MKTMQRWIVLAAVLFCLTAAVLPVSAEDAVREKTMTLTLINDVLHLNPSTDTVALWEYPALSRGEKCPAGTLTLYNNTAYTAEISLSEIALPYDDVAALEYLNQVYVTVRDGDTKLYEGTYAHIADADGGLEIHEEIAPGADKVYTIELARTFQAVEDASPVIAWQFSSRVSYDTFSGNESAKWWLLGALLGIVAIVLVAVLIRKLIRKE